MRNCLSAERFGNPATRRRLPRPVTPSASAVICMALLTVGGCANMLRTVEVQQPMTARPPTPPAPVAGNGAIFRAAAFQPLFEDRRARAIGDTLTININEKLNASKTASTNADRKGGTAFNLADVQYGGTSVVKGAAVKAD